MTSRAWLDVTTHDVPGAGELPPLKRAPLQVHAVVTVAYQRADAIGVAHGHDLIANLIFAPTYPGIK
jgi:hypothetical protein